MCEPLPELVHSAAGINIVRYGELYYRVPQRLGTVCLEVFEERAALRSFYSLQAAVGSIAWRDYIRYPFWRAKIAIRGWYWRLIGFEPAVKRCPSWGP